MQKFKTFYFESFSFDKEKLEAKFSYSFDREEFFDEIIYFESDKFKFRDDLDFKKINNLFFHLHLALGISYYKLCPTKDLVVKSGILDEKQINFWKKFYKNGLWEFMVKNHIIFEWLLNFKNQSPYPNPISKGENIGQNVVTSLPGGEIDRGLFADISKDNNGSLLMWWGWKDSIVSSVLLDECCHSELDSESISKFNFNQKKDPESSSGWQGYYTPFIFWKIDRIKENTLEVLWKKPMLVRRKLSENLFKLNEEGYYNGHVPITWIIAFVSLVSAYIYDYKDIVLSNEKSADEENTIYKWLKINHQYSKWWEFEVDFRKYVKENISNNINYFSLLRDKYEFEIASIFAKKAKKYFNSFSSCNRNFKIKQSPLSQPFPPKEKGVEQNVASSLPRGEIERGSFWCCECEKCAFVYLILSVFLEEVKLISIFWENLLDKKSLLETYKWLLWFTDFKPFECVWTYDESFLSASKTLEKYKNKINTWENIKLPYILNRLEADIKIKSKDLDLASLEKKFLGK